MLMSQIYSDYYLQKDFPPKHQPWASVNSDYLEVSLQFSWQQQMFHKPKFYCYPHSAGTCLQKQDTDLQTAAIDTLLQKEQLRSKLIG